VKMVLGYRILENASSYYGHELYSKSNDKEM